MDMQHEQLFCLNGAWKKRNKQTNKHFFSRIYYYLGGKEYSILSVSSIHCFLNNSYLIFASHMGESPRVSLKSLEECGRASIST